MPVRAPKNHRGDIHSSFSLTPSATPRRRRPRTQSFGDMNMNSDGTVMDLPASTRTLSAAAEPEEDEPDELRAIWGTDVNIIDTMASFRDFLSGFKPKYRAAHDRSRGLPSKMFNTPEEGEVVLYENYLRRMRKTGETVLNLDVVNLLAYPRSTKLYYQLQKYPQELIPAFDTVLKNAMLELAQADMEDMQMGANEVTEEDLGEIMGAIYKVRPFGLETVNMRELNPQGSFFSFLQEVH
jgi:DNA replication licensing factor MCM4